MSRATVSPAAEPQSLRDVSIRYAGSCDAQALAALATLDSKDGLGGDVLLAEVDGVPVAALAVDDGAHVADPFRPTLDLVQMLELRAAQIRAAAAPARRSWLMSLTASRRVLAGR
jgi:hypothetical protein